MESPADFGRAIAVAEENATNFLPGVTGMKLEGIVTSGNDFEVTLSYYISGKNPLELSSRKKNDNLGLLAAMMTTRREYKVFIVERRTFVFKGFKNYKE